MLLPEFLGLEIWEWICAALGMSLPFMPVWGNPQWYDNPTVVKLFNDLSKNLGPQFERLWTDLTNNKINREQVLGGLSGITDETETDYFGKKIPGGTKGSRAGGSAAGSDEAIKAVEDSANKFGTGVSDSVKDIQGKRDSEIRDAPAAYGGPLPPSFSGESTPFRRLGNSAYTNIGSGWDGQESSWENFNSAWEGVDNPWSNYEDPAMMHLKNIMSAGAGDSAWGDFNFNIGGPTTNNDLSRLAGLAENVHDMKDYDKYIDRMMGAGQSEEARNRLMANGLYEDWIRTGGINQDQAANIYSRAQAPLAASQSLLGGQLNDAAARQGGTVNYGAAAAGMDRASMEQMRNQALASAMSVDQMRNANRMQAGQAMTGAQTAQNQIDLAGGQAAATARLGQGNLNLQGLGLSSQNFQRMEDNAFRRTQLEKQLEMAKLAGLDQFGLSNADLKLNAAGKVSDSSFRNKSADADWLGRSLDASDTAAMNKAAGLDKFLTDKLNAGDAMELARALGLDNFNLAKAAGEQGDEQFRMNAELTKWLEGEKAAEERRRMLAGFADNDVTRQIDSEQFGAKQLESVMNAALSKQGIDADMFKFMKTLTEGQREGNMDKDMQNRLAIMSMYANLFGPDAMKGGSAFYDDPKWYENILAAFGGAAGSAAGAAVVGGATSKLGGGGKSGGN